MTRIQMEAVINAGGQVLWLGNRLTTIESLPSQDEINAVYTATFGPSAYDVAVEDGFVGTESEWLASLVGPAGTDGIDGTDGADSTVPGPQGIQGIPGADGADGLDGTGAGNMNGPASSVDGNIPLFDGTTGELLKDSGVALSSKQDALGFTAVPNTRTVNGHALSADVTVSKSDVGLGSADNTSDAGKPVSTAQQTALDLKAPLASPAFTGTPTGITKTHVGLGNVDNTTDAGKPVSTTQQTALDLKAPLASPAFTGTPTGITKTHVGLGSVDNTADTGKPVSTAQQTAIDGKVDDTAYNATSWDGVTTIAPSKNAVRDKIETLGAPAESVITFTDITTNNLSTTKHGFAPKAPNNSYAIIGGTGLFKVRRQPMHMGVMSAGLTTGTKYYSVLGENTTESLVRFSPNEGFYIVKLAIWCVGSGSGTGTTVFTLQKSGVDTALVINMGTNSTQNASGSGADDTDSHAGPILFNGEGVTIKAVNSGGSGTSGKYAFSISYLTTDSAT